MNQQQTLERIVLPDFGAMETLQNYLLTSRPMESLNRDWLRQRLLDGLSFAIDGNDNIFTHGIPRNIEVAVNTRLKKTIGVLKRTLNFNCSFIELVATEILDNETIMYAVSHFEANDPQTSVYQ